MTTSAVPPATSIPSTAPSTAPSWRFELVALAETLALAGLLANLALGNAAGVAASLGPVHGCLYLLAITMTWLEHRSRRVRLISVVPVLGAPLAVLLIKREQAAAG